MAEETVRTEKAEKAAAKPAKKPKQKKEHKIGKFFKDLKSELKKITWYSAHDTIHSSIWTIIALVVFTVVIGGVNWGLSSLIAIIS